VIYLASLPVGWWSAYRLRRRDLAERAATGSARGTAPRIVRFGGERDGSERPGSQAN
jgi:hypothetical protein